MNSKTIKTVLLVMVLIFLVYACDTTRSVVQEGDENEEINIMQDSSYLILSEYFSTISDSICGKGRSRGKDVCALVLANDNLYSCLRTHNYNLFKEVMKFTLRHYPFNNTCYTQMLDFWDDVHDEEFFGMALELLKEDYEPDVEGFSGYFPVYQYVYDNLITPNIKTVSGKPFIEFARENEECFRGYLQSWGEDQHIYCYNLLKPLWDAGEIELYGEEHFRKK